MSSASETADKILDATEQVYASQGVEGLTLRLIAEHAGVNLASTNYHFGSKTTLILEMLHRRLQPLNLASMQLLDQYEFVYGDKIRPIHVVSSIILPIIGTISSSLRGALIKASLLRMSSETAPVLRTAMSQKFRKTCLRVDQLFCESFLPLSNIEARRRLHIFSNAIPGTLCNSNTLVLLEDLMKDTDTNRQEILLWFGGTLERTRFGSEEYVLLKSDIAKILSMQHTSGL